MTLTIGPLFGVPNESELPKLPVGFRWKLRPGHWVKAVDTWKKDQEWYCYAGDIPRLVRCHHATQEDVDRTAANDPPEHRFKPGDEFMGDEEIQLTP